MASDVTDDNTNRNQKVLKATTSGNARDKNINFAIDTEQVPCRKNTNNSP